ncbi:MAG: hypothetical protein AB7S38_23415 [Vulcanimicrobiota bacterium]
MEELRAEVKKNTNTLEEQGCKLDRLEEKFDRSDRLEPRVDRLEQRP